MRAPPTSALALFALAFLAARGDPAPLQEPTASLLDADAVLFVENRGQWSTDACLVSRGGPALMRAEPGAIGVQLRSREGERMRGLYLRLVFDGARDDASIEGEGELPARFHFFLGDDPSRWRSDVPAWRRVRYRGIYRGIDLVLRTEGGRPEYDLELEPGADLSQVAVRCEGAELAGIDGEGALWLASELGLVRQSPPRTWTVGPGGEKEEVDSRFVALNRHSFGFEASWDPSLALVIDPGIEWATFFSGSGPDQAYAVAVGDDGRVTIGGVATSWDLPTTPGAFDPTFNDVPDPANYGDMGDGFLARFDPTRTGAEQLSWATYIGGGRSEKLLDLALSPEGVTFCGATRSRNMPTTPGAFQTHFGPTLPWPGHHPFVARLSDDGSRLVYSSFVRGSASGYAQALDLASDGSVVLGGITLAPDLPTTPGAYARAPRSLVEAFLSHLDLSGHGASDLRYGTYLGSSDGESIDDLVLHGPEEVTVIGTTRGTDFPTTPGAFDRIHSGWFLDGFVARLRLRGDGPADLRYSSFLSGGLPRAVAVDPSGRIVLGGSVDDAAFPTTPGAFDSTMEQKDGFLAILRPRGDGPADLEYSTFLGGGASDAVAVLAVDGSGRILAGGTTWSDDFPTTPGAWQQAIRGVSDGFVAVLAPRGEGQLDLEFASLFGGSGGEGPSGLALAGYGRAVLTGTTDSVNFPVTPGAFQQTWGAWGSTFVLLFDSRPEPTVYCTAKVNSLGCTPAIGWSGIPSASGPDPLVVRASGVLSAQPGLLAWSLSPAATPFAGGFLCIDAPRVRTPVQDSGGTFLCEGAYAFTFTPAYLAARGLAPGDEVFAQWWSRDPGYPPPQDVGLTDAVRFHVLP